VKTADWFYNTTHSGLALTHAHSDHIQTAFSCFLFKGLVSQKCSRNLSTSNC